MRILHTFNGINKDKPYIKPNWLVTRIWKFAKDVIAAGLIIICISRRKRDNDIYVLNQSKQKPDTFKIKL